MTITPETLASIKVLWRQPDTLALWGIPYAMRAGQQPYDLWRSTSYPATLAQGISGARIEAPGPRFDWVWLGSPGWWGSMTAAEQALVTAWLAGRDLPDGPCEWTEVA